MRLFLSGATVWWVCINVLQLCSNQDLHIMTDFICLFSSCNRTNWKTHEYRNVWTGQGGLKPFRNIFFWWRNLWFHLGPCSKVVLLHSLSLSFVLFPWFLQFFPVPVLSHALICSLPSTVASICCICSCPQSSWPCHCVSSLSWMLSLRPAQAILLAPASIPHLQLSASNLSCSVFLPDLFSPRCGSPCPYFLQPVHVVLVPEAAGSWEGQQPEPQLFCLLLWGAGEEKIQLSLSSQAGDCSLQMVL